MPHLTSKSQEVDPPNIRSVIFFQSWDDSHRLRRVRLVPRFMEMVFALIQDMSSNREFHSVECTGSCRIGIASVEVLALVGLLILERIIDTLATAECA